MPMRQVENDTGLLSQVVESGEASWRESGDDIVQTDIVIHKDKRLVCPLPELEGLGV